MRMAKIKQEQMTTILSAGEDMEQLARLTVAGGDAKWGAHSEKELGGFL